MKTFEDVLNKALLIASLDKNARVAVFDLRIRQKVSDNVDKFNTGILQSHMMRYIDESGGEVLFFDAGRELFCLTRGNNHGNILEPSVEGGFLNNKGEQQWQLPY